MKSPIWLEHREQLRRYVGKRINEVDAVDDVLQEIYLKVHDRYHSLRSPDSITAWLYRIASNCIVDFYRSRRPMESLTDTIETPSSEHNVEPELAACMRPLIESLSPTYRSVLILSELEGVAHKGVAQQLGLSIPAVKSRVIRGRKELLKRLLACCEVDREEGRIAAFQRRPGVVSPCDEDCS